MQPRTPAIFELSLVAHQFLIDREYQQAINYFKAQPKSLENHIILAFFLSLTNKRIEAKEEIQTAIKLVGANKDEILISWGDFFDKYHQAELSLVVYQAATDSLLNERDSVVRYFSTPRADNPDLIVRTAKAAIEAGDPELAETYLLKLRTFQSRFDNRSLFRLAAANYGRIFLNTDLYADLDNVGDMVAKYSYYNHFSSYSVEDVLYQAIRKAINGCFVQDSPLEKRNKAENKNNPDLYYKCEYLYHLFNSHEPRHSSELADILQAKDAPRVWRMLSGVALCQMNIEYIKPIFIAHYEQEYKKFKPEIESIEENCVYLIATRIMHILTQDDKYQTEIKRCLNGGSRVALNVLLPFAIPYYLRIAFLEVILDSAYWLDTDLTIAPEILAIMKVQYAAFVESKPRDFGHMGLNTITQINLATQVISTTTNIGRIIKIPQGIDPTTLTTGTSLIFMEFLKNRLETDPCFFLFLFPSTLQALITIRLSELKGKFNDLAQKLKAQDLISPINTTKISTSVSAYLGLRNQTLEELEEIDSITTPPTLSAVFKRASELEERRLALKRYAIQPSGLQKTGDALERSVLSPRHYDAYWFNATFYSKQNLKKYEDLKKLSEDPENNVPLQKLFSLGVNHQQAGDVAAARASFHTTIIACARLEKYNLHNVDTQKIAALAHVRLGCIALDEGDAKMALLEFQLASEPLQKCLELKVFMIEALVKLNKLTEAKTLLAQLTQADSFTLVAHLIIAEKDKTHLNVKDFLTYIAEHGYLSQDVLTRDICLAKMYAVTNNFNALKDVLRRITPNFIDLGKLKRFEKDLYLSIVINLTLSYWPPVSGPMSKDVKNAYLCIMQKDKNLDLALQALPGMSTILSKSLHSDTTQILDIVENILSNLKEPRQLAATTEDELTALLKRNLNLINSIQKNYPLTAGLLKKYSPKSAFGLFDSTPVVKDVPDAVKENIEQGYNLDL